MAYYTGCGKAYFLFHMAFHIQKRKLACRTLYEVNKKIIQSFCLKVSGDLRTERRTMDITEAGYKNMNKTKLAWNSFH
jgi:hypothetical protein